MSASNSARTVLVTIVTAVVVSMAWIFSDMPADVPPTDEPVWRYTSEGWKELSEWVAPPQSFTPGLLDNVSPFVWGSLQLLIALVILISFAEDAPKSQPAPITIPAPKKTRRHRQTIAIASKGDV